ncbi:MAG: YdjY domain-containing protein [Planctomycetaceae bacterium]
MPGLVIDLERRCLDLAGVICLDRGPLELIACTQGTKEHESIVALPARAIHVHTALLLLGANNGHPATQKPINAEKTRWIRVPPRGDPIEVFLVTKSKDGKPVERPISEFIARSNERVDEVDGTVTVAPGEEQRRHGESRPDSRLPHTFIFAGSHLRDNGPGPRLYLADVSGNVISIATFGDEVLCLPFHETQQDGALMWRVKPQSLPGVGTKVTLRLRPKRKPAGSVSAAPADTEISSGGRRPETKHARN